MSETADQRPEWLRRKHGKQRTEPYLDMLAAAPRCHTAGDGAHEHSIVIRTVHDLEGNELPIRDEDEARNVVNALYRSRPRGDGGAFLISLPRPHRVQLPDGSWEVRCCVHEKAHGDAYVAANPGRKAYDPAARVSAAATQRPARRRRPSAAAQRQQAEAEARGRAYAQTLATEPVGGGSHDIRVWALDHGQAEPASAAERQRRDAAIAARLKAQRDARRQDHAAEDGQGAQQPLSKAAKAAAAWWKSLG